RGVLNELFRFDKFSNETEKLIHTFAEHMPANAIHIYSANFPQSVGSHLRRNILGDALGQGIVDLEGAISFCARCAGEGDDTGRYARTSSLFKGLVMAVKRGMIEPGMLLNFYDSLIENDKNSGKKELTLSILDTIDDLASIIPSGRIESSDVIGLYDKIFYPRPRTDISFFRVALEALARTIPSGRTEPEEILRRFNDYFSTMGSWDEVDWDCTLRTLKGLYESVPSEMKGDIKRLYSLYFEQHPRKGPDPNHRMFVDTARQADIGSLGDLDLKSFAALIPEKHIDPKKVVSLYEACLGVCIIEDIDKLASAILSGNVDADDVIKVYRKCAKTEPWRALRSLPSLVDCIPSGRVTAHSCAGLFEEALKKDKFDFGDDRIDETISAYISLVGYGVIRPEEVMKRYEDCLDDDKNRVDCAKKLWLMLPLVEFGKLAPESVFGLYKKFVDGRTDHFFEFGKESLNALIRLTDHPGLALNEVIDFFRLLVDKGWSLANRFG
ncbi:MAG: hypothetical protein NT001_03240, partial [Candidatus Woesearchaeota archaeon]|nr:hypothetical protein [Candidatus Woesearchaeota archaeon]